MDGKGLLFAGHAEAGKSTRIRVLRGHGELPDVSPAGGPLRAILFLDKAGANELIPIVDRRERLGRVLSHVVGPLTTADWWEKILSVAGQRAAEVPAYRLQFDRSGGDLGVLSGVGLFLEWRGNALGRGGLWQLCRWLDPARMVGRIQGTGSAVSAVFAEADPIPLQQSIVVERG